MLKFVLVLILCVGQLASETTTPAPGEAWVTRARVLNAVGYFSNVVQEFSYELEKREWCNLRLIDINQNVSTLIANWNVTGTVLYTNGFVISIQKIDVSSITSTVSRTVEEGVVIPTASVRGRMHFRHMNMGYDVFANLTDIGEKRYTGEIMNNHVAWEFNIMRNVLTKEFTVTASLSVLEGALIRMIYSPADQITEVLSRSIATLNNWNGIVTWRDNFITILMDVVTNKVEFPEICFNNCT